ncbi:hypothetical protein [Mesorhizobium sp. M0965]|uniref:hypothetical protein n=1 Tax=Mesorhizobium sp. M0965 TaxID=2957036 RepID=UPI00333D938C
MLEKLARELLGGIFANGPEQSLGWFWQNMLLNASQKKTARHKRILYIPRGEAIIVKEVVGAGALTRQQCACSCEAGY